MTTTEVICAKIGDCEKIKMVMDKDLAGDWQYAEAIRAVCKKCREELHRAIAVCVMSDSAETCSLDKCPMLRKCYPDVAEILLGKD